MNRIGSGAWYFLKSWLAVVALTLLGVPSVFAEFAESVRDTKPSFSLRYRFEGVDQDGIEKEAQASTMKARLSWITPADPGFSIGLEGDFVFVLPPGADENFNSTQNGRIGYPVVADPTDFDLNQAFLRFHQEGFTLTAGRQRINHFEQRFVAGAAWRQNEQTFDALRIQSSHGALSLDYSYVMNVNRIFGPDDGIQPGDWEGDSHLFRGAAEIAEGQSLGAFAYLLDFENDNGPPNSTATYGIDYLGVWGPLSVMGSLARQKDWADSPLSYEATYYTVEARLKSGPMTFTAGYEVMGSDNRQAAFRTPLGSLHKFQGWADKFTGTPLAGVKDAYVAAATNLGPVALTLVAHDYRAAKGGADYGREFGVMASYPIRDNFSALVKFTQYDADEHATDTSKFWLMLTYRI